MSTETLRADLQACMNEAKALADNPELTPHAVCKHLNDTLWPLLSNVVEEVADIDETVSDMYEHAEDILQPDTGAQLLAVIAGAEILVGELKTRVGNDARLLAAIKEWSAKAAESKQAITDITITTEEEDDDDDDGDDDDDDGDDDAPDDDQGEGDDAPKA